TCKPDVMESLVDMYGGLFFIGILLSFLFLMAAVLIIYYKQISEGYEDQGRFEIMQKVGMTTKDIKASINSQVLTVFFAPLLLAGVHLAFAYPLIWKVLKLLMVNNLTYVIFVTVVIYVAFTLFYVLVYKWTAGTYYRIVNGGRKTK
ncbi:MAG: ABC transporter permease, partial [Lachnospiraceae bacterium]|nr:ABC transporter permease [Lachnospiraceae bacterium]